ncbi:Trk system potassium transport protein TrkA [Halarchaeum grantii]|uniref:Trk system potassium transport protein TrkA n=1 Tax=Halarchaeum grantii TaxID=1193105 RepID=A0A830F629_9EURY|nr:Trk system potassium transporter TrkA [Halarchaeum grantii]GGL22905.1 Trk system potassium transport protein TrkA [Halarchaeum grantii]
MRVVIVGAGEVGSSIAASLAESHDVVVVDVDSERVERLTYEHDVLTVEGDGASLDTLRAADVSKADIVIASTDDDETNLAICGTVKTASGAFTIARVQNRAYLETWRHSQGVFGVDFMVCTDLLTAQSIVRIVGLPTARDVDPFAGGRVQMAEFEVTEGSPLAGQTVQEADRFDALTFAAVIRGDDVEIARGDTAIDAGDKVVVIGRPGSVEAFAAAVVPEGGADEVGNVVIVGGSSVGELTGRLLSERGFVPRLIEQDPERARELAETLSKTTVLEHDATDAEFLEREHVGEAGLLVAALDSDERNLLVSLLAKRLGVNRTVAIVDNPAYVDLFEAVGVDVAINPREVTAEEITRFTRERRMENVAIVEPGAAEVLEVEIDEESALAGRSIREAVADLPDGVVVGAITRNGEFVTPRGDTVVQVGDHVVAFVREDALDAVTATL